jgi:DNA-binding protein HU-beta
MASGDSVQLIDFGSFNIIERQRVICNPLTGTPVQVEVSKVASFKADKALKDAVNNV